MSKSITFASAVDASKYISGGSTAAPGFALKSIDYDANAYVGQVRNADGSLHPQVVGVNVTAAAEDNAATDIRAAIAATLA